MLILSLLAFSFITVKATEYYHVTILVTPFDTTQSSFNIDTYWTVDSNVVNALYLSLSDYNNQLNNALIAVNGFSNNGVHSNDNVFNYNAGPSANPVYGIDDNGVAFQNSDGTNYQLICSTRCYIYPTTSTNYADLTVSSPIQPPLTSFAPTASPTSFAPTTTPTAIPTASPTSEPTNPTAAPTFTPTNHPKTHYKVTITYNDGSLPINNMTLDTYWVVDTNIVIAVYLSISDYNTQNPINNQILATDTLGGNDNFFNYTVGPPYYGIDGPGISFNVNSVGYNMYTSPLVFDSDNSYNAYIVAMVIPRPGYATATPTSAPTPPPITYFKSTLVIPGTNAATVRWFAQSTTTYTNYFTVQSGQVTGVYGSQSDYNALTNNIVILIGGYSGNDNVFTGGSTSPYGITANGVGFTNSANQCDLSYASSAFTLTCGSGATLTTTPVTSLSIVSAATPTFLGGSTGSSGGSSSSSSTSSPLVALAALAAIPFVGLAV